MRAERLLRIVVLLQARGRVSAGELARELEVSPRTIQRDMEALSGAGIPVYATRGGDGGWEVLKAYRTNLAGLTASDVLAVAVGRPAKLLSELGLDDPGEGPVLKLMEAVSPSAKEQVVHARERLHVDLSGWGSSQTEPSLSVLQDAVWNDRVVRMRYRGSRSAFIAQPLGLVSKAGSWYLVAKTRDDYRTYNVARIHDIEVTEQVFERPDDFDLAAYWERAQAEFTESFPSYVVKLRLRGDALTRAGWTYARTKTISAPDARGWATAELDVQDEENALRTVRTLGNDVIVRSPARLRRLAVAEARTFVRANVQKAPR
jgi:predicted DNA-binding transcriptional regulator YafY